MTLSTSSWGKSQNAGGVSVWPRVKGAMGDGAKDCPDKSRETMRFIRGKRIVTKMRVVTRMVVAFHEAERDLIGCTGLLCVKAFAKPRC